jgi:hypothetical protein
MALFSATEQKINAACMRRLANAQADFGGGLLVDGIFDSLPVDEYGTQSNIPQFQCLSSDISAVSRGAGVVINSVSYTVKIIEPDGTGMALVELTKA